MSSRGGVGPEMARTFAHTGQRPPQGRFLNLAAGPTISAHPIVNAGCTRFSDTSITPLKALTLEQPLFTRSATQTDCDTVERKSPIAEFDPTHATSLEETKPAIPAPS
jgi:hypothetical protein